MNARPQWAVLPRLSSRLDQRQEKDFAVRYRYFGVDSAFNQNRISEQRFLCSSPLD